MKKVSFIFLQLLFAMVVLAQQKINFNQGWVVTTIQLSGGDTAHLHIGKNWNDQFTTETVLKPGTSIGNKTLPYEQEMAALKGAHWLPATLPHIAFPEPLVIERPKEGIAYYKKTFAIPANYKGQKISIEFEGAMQMAWVWFNGKFVTQHLGGYLPFTVDITKLAKYGQPNIITVKVDNRPNPLVPPGKPVSRLDFVYYSGLYRDAWMHVDDLLHITDPNAIDRPGGGGIFVTYPKVTDAQAIINIKTNIINEGTAAKTFDLIQELADAKGNIVATSKSNGNNLKEGDDAHYVQELNVTHPALWSPDSPYLYTLKSYVVTNGKQVNEHTTKIGIRSFFISKETGLLINGRPFRIEGSNRHESYPWIGNALSNNASLRDAIMIKESGMNCIRLSHYCQDPSFYDACDSLGILLLNCTPGWQFFNKSDTFISNTFSDIRQMIRRDRNHPSILLWEVSLNETYPSADYRCKQVETAKAEWPSGLNFYTSGDSYFTKACYDVPYDDWADNIEARDNTTYPGNAYLIREYGDFEFGGAESTTRQLRGNGEKALLQQAWNLQWEHNRNRQQYPRAIGDLTWAFFDGLAGYVEGIEGWGIADIKRIPKFSYYFFQSQRKDKQPMCYIADYWTPADTTGKIIVYSNCDEVALYINGREVSRHPANNGPDSPYGTELDKGGNPFDGGNGKALQSPPFTFSNISFEAGELKAIGYINGKQVVINSVHTPGKAAKIILTADTHGVPIKADGADVVFIRAAILDANNNLVANANNEIQFSVSGNALLIDSPVVKAEAGIATILLRSSGTKPGNVEIKATGKGVTAGTLFIQTHQ